MRKFIIALLLGGILVGAAYGTAATLGLTGVDSIGSNQAVVTGSGSISNVTYGLSDDITIAKNAQITLPGTSSISDQLDFIIKSGSCSGTTQFTISTTGASGVRTINLDVNGGGTDSGGNLGTKGLAVSLIDCVQFTLQQEN